MSNRLFGYLLLCACLSSQSSPVKTQPVVVKSSRSGKTTILLQIDFRGKALTMFCVIQPGVCRDLKPGKYLMTLAQHPAYTDCDNVDVYPEGADLAKTKPLGTYGLAYGLWKSN